MVIRGNVILLGAEPRDPVSGDGDLKALLSPVGGLKTPFTPLSPRLSRQTSIRRNYSITATVTVAGPAYSTIPTATSISSGPTVSSAMAQADTKRHLEGNSDPSTQDFQVDIKVSSALPSKPTLEKIADLPVFDVNGKTVSFKSLYWPESIDGKRILIIFIRHFFCGVSIVLDALFDADND